MAGGMSHDHGRTERLDLADATLREWDAVVLDVDDDSLVLDRSAFYPGGGGQPPDYGVLLWGGVETRIVGARRVAPPCPAMLCLHESIGSNPPTRPAVDSADGSNVRPPATRQPRPAPPQTMRHPRSTASCGPRQSRIDAPTPLTGEARSHASRVTRVALLSTARCAPHQSRPHRFGQCAPTQSPPTSARAP